MPRRSLLVFVWLLSALPARAQVRAGGEFRLTASTSGGETHASVAVGPASQAVVVWDEQGRDGALGGIFGRRFDAKGTPLGAEFRVNTTTTGDQFHPSVAADPRGGFVVAWSDLSFDNFGVMAQRYDAAGAAQGGEFRVGTAAVAVADSPVMAFDAGGGFVVAWRSPDDGYGGAGIQARRFDAAGAPLDDGVRVNSTLDATQLDPWVARAPTGAFVVAWSSYNHASPVGWQALGQRFAADGSRLGAEFQVSSGAYSIHPSVAMAADGRFVAAYEDLAGRIVARRFDAAGAPVGPEVVVTMVTAAAPLDPAVAADADGGFTVAWTLRGQEVDVYTARFDAGGRPRGAEFRVNTTVPDRQYLDRQAPPLAADAAGNFTVVWATYDASAATTGLFGQRFGGLLAAADRVDTGPGGNAVLEPGETVDLRPSWRNVNGAAQSFTGTLARLQGPAGATYTITDGSASYGTVANGATGACTDCYTVGVSAPATRPATHWDALAVEKLAPDALGQVARWPLHVGGSFTDVTSGSAYYRFVETLLHRGVTAGCNADHYCPGLGVTRAQMAVFVLVSQEGNAYVPPACATPVLFDDVPAESGYCRWVEELARRGVVTGCGPRAFCPDDAVSRDQMAVFLLRTLDPTLDPPACAPPNLFADVPETSAYCRWIEELARRGVTGGCGGGNYCPLAPLTREQMAAFLTTTFGLTLDGP